ncbi:iron hydrogenase [Russula ochroleuca]|uniref:Iron hydrogenase n=1 Tax=Russula ochroleuca TaxID=152965 RepID=A0A9P5K0B6_9AGAM|nr:iron hydrogenase [Russula ochroleuca]
MPIPLAHTLGFARMFDTTFTREILLSFIATTKSPQQVMGTLVKEWLAPHYWDYHSLDEVYHVTVVPCFDKKLEASRSETYHEFLPQRTVATRSRARHRRPMIASPFPFPKIFLYAQPPPVLLGLLRPPGSSSGLYLHSLMLAVAHTYPHPQP